MMLSEPSLQRWLEPDVAKGRVPMEQDNDLSRKVIGCCVDVHRALGPGFGEPIYRQAVAVELEKRGIGFESAKPVSVRYEGREVGRHRLDMVVNDEIVVHMLTTIAIEPRHYAQVRSYVRAAGKHVGLLVNFSDARLDVRRVEI